MIPLEEYGAFQELVELCQSDSDGNVVILDECVCVIVFTQWGSLASEGAALISVSSLYTALYIHSLVCCGPQQSFFGNRRESASLGEILTGALFMGITSVLCTPAPPR